MTLMLSRPTRGVGTQINFKILPAAAFLGPNMPRPNGALCPMGRSQGSPLPSGPGSHGAHMGSYGTKFVENRVLLVAHIGHIRAHIVPRKTPEIV